MLAMKTPVNVQTSEMLPGALKPMWRSLNSGTFQKTSLDILGTEAKNKRPQTNVTMTDYSTLSLPANWDRSVVEVAGHLLRPSFKEPNTIFNFATSIWIECRIVQVGFDGNDHQLDMRSTCELSASERSTKSSTAKGKKLGVLASVSKKHASHVIVASPFEESQYATVSCQDVFLPRSLISLTPIYGAKDPSDFLSCGDEVEVFQSTPFAAWYPGFVSEIAVFNGSKQATLQVLAEDAHYCFHFVQMFSSEVLWRLALIPRLSIVAAGGLFSETFKHVTSLPNKVEQEDITDLLQVIKSKSGILRAQVVVTSNPPHFVFVGFENDILTAKNILLDVLKNQSSFSVEERKQKRLQFLAARRDAYQNPHVLEFLIRDVYVGVVIGRRGEKLSQVAKDLHVELRVLPEDNGFRRVRIYGRYMKDAQQAKEALELVYQKILLSDVLVSKLKENLIPLKLISQRANLHFTMLHEKQGALIIFGVRRSLKQFRERLRKVLRSLLQTEEEDVPIAF